MIDRRTALATLLALGGGLAFGPARGWAQAKGVALLMFDDPGCPYCRKWHREVGPAYSKSEEGRRAPLRVLQIRDPRPAEIKLASPVRATPTFVLVQDGREVGRLTGYGGADFFWSMLAEELKKLKPGAQGA